jgi:hypothetical protein
MGQALFRGGGGCCEVSEVCARFRAGSAGFSGAGRLCAGRVRRIRHRSQGPAQSRKMGLPHFGDSAAGAARTSALHPLSITARVTTASIDDTGDPGPTQPSPSKYFDTIASAVSVASACVVNVGLGPPRPLASAELSATKALHPPRFRGGVEHRVDRVRPQSHRAVAVHHERGIVAGRSARTRSRGESAPVVYARFGCKAGQAAALYSAHTYPGP